MSFILFLALLLQYIIQRFTIRPLFSFGHCCSARNSLKSSAVFSFDIVLFSLIFFLSFYELFSSMLLAFSFYFLLILSHFCHQKQFIRNNHYTDILDTVITCLNKKLFKWTGEFRRQLSRIYFRCRIFF